MLSKSVVYASLDGFTWIEQVFAVCLSFLGANENIALANSLK